MKLIIFDMYGTLISTGTGSLDAVRKILSLQEKDIPPETFYSDWKKLHRKNTDIANRCCFVPESVIFKKDLQLLYRKYHINRNADEDVSFMLNTFGKRKCFDETISVINKLRETHRVVIGSTSDTQPLLQDMANNNLTADAVYTSEMIRKYKPSPVFYQYILDKENVLASDALFVGDSYTDDVIGPMQVGIRSILVDRNKNFSDKGKNILTHRIVNSLDEIELCIH